MDEFYEMRPKKLKISNYEILRTLGTGTFGRVKLGKLKNSDKEIIIAGFYAKSNESSIVYDYLSYL